MMIKKVSLALLVLVSGINLFSQPAQGGWDPANMPKESKITGNVIDQASEKPIEYVTIGIFRQKDSTLVTGGITDVHGHFLIDNLPYGRFYVEISFVGFKKTKVNGVGLNPSMKIADLGTIKLEPSVTALNEVEVVGNKSQLEYKIDKKVVNVSANVAASGGTAVDVLENTPSVQVDIEGNVALRGSSNFNVLIDGKPSVLKGSEALQQLPASTIQSIEIITNPSAKFDPDGSAGIINVIMKKQKQAGVNGIVNASASTNGSYSGDFLVNLRASKFNYYIGANTNKRIFKNSSISNQYKNILSDTVFRQTTTSDGEFNRDGMGVKGGLEYSINSKNILSLSGALNSFTFGRDANSNDHRYYAPANSYDIYNHNVNSFSVKRNSYEANLDYQLKLNDKGQQLLASATYSKEKSDDGSLVDQYLANSNWVITNQNAASQKTDEKDNETNFRAKLDYTLPISEKSKFEAGYELRYQNSTGEYHYSTRTDDISTWNEDLTRFNDKVFTNEIHSVYSTYSNALGELFDYQVGLRLEYNHRNLTQKVTNQSYDFNKWDYFPSVHVSKKLSRDYQVQASYTRRVNRPRDRDLDPFQTIMDSLNIRQGNPGLLPEYTNSYELNMQKSFKGAGFISFELFERQTDNEITQYQYLDSTVTINTVENLNKEYATGGEFMVNLPLAKWWTLNTSVSAYDDWIKGKISGVSTDKHNLSWNSRFSSMFRLPWSTQLQVTGFYNAPSITPQGTRHGFFFSNIGLRKDLWQRKATISLQVRDLFGNMKFKNESKGTNFQTFSEMKRESRVFTLSFSYKINNYRQQQRREQQNQGMNEMDFEGGGGDM